MTIVKIEKYNEIQINVSKKQPSDIKEAEKEFCVTGEVTCYFSSPKIYQKLKDNMQLRHRDLFINNNWVYKRFMIESECDPSYEYYSGIVCDTDNLVAADSAISSAIKKAMGEKSIADKAYDKFKSDERKHTSEKRKVVKSLSTMSEHATALELGASMVMMWELMSDGYVDDVTPSGRTGGITSPQTTYCYKITCKGMYWVGIGIGY